MLVTFLSVNAGRQTYGRAEARQVAGTVRFLDVPLQTPAQINKSHGFDPGQRRHQKKKSAETRTGHSSASGDTGSRSVCTRAEP